MRISSSKNVLSKRLVLAITVLAVSVIGAGVFYFIEQSKKAQLETLKTTQPSTSSKQQVEESSNLQEGLPEKSTGLTSDQVPEGQDLSVKITEYSQTNNRVYAKATTSGIGTCVFLFRPGDDGKPVTKETSSDEEGCKIELPTSEFSYIGSWRLTVTYYSQGQKTEASRDVQVQ